MVASATESSRSPPPVPQSRGGGSSSGTGSSSRKGLYSEKRRVGPYLVSKTLGTGSFGKVKLATHQMTGHQVALKFINNSKITTPDMDARIKREISYLKVLRHPHIIKLYETIRTQNEVIMVMEFAGEELFNYIVSQGKAGMGEDEARRLFQQMIAAIEYCHRHQIVHRDLKPENLFLDSKKNVKIGDFGLSNYMADGDFLKTSCGSPNYAAPEVISGKLYSGPEIDVWSAGVIMYVLLCGKLPFDDENIPSLFRKIESGSYSLPSHISDEARHLLKRMLCVDPVKRATIVEIREMPFFQYNLPRYLQPLPDVETYPVLPMDDLSTLLLINEGQADPKKVAESKGMLYTDDLGIIDPEIVTELLEKMGYPDDVLLAMLQENGENTVKTAYQLVRDHKRLVKDAYGIEEEQSNAVLEEFMASSPPEWYIGARHKPLLDEVDEDAWEDEEEVEIQDIPNAHFDVLNSSLPHPNHSDRYRASAVPLPQMVKEKPLAKPKWHFGIRSRSPPMEVMLEIYRTLDTLNMQWKHKPMIPLPEIGPPPLDGYTEEVDDVFKAAAERGKPLEMGKDRPPKRELSAQDKAAQGLYLVETRARYGDIIVRMDLQLYRVDGENYLVDFRNMGYYHTADSTMPEAVKVLAPPGSFASSTGGALAGHSQAGSIPGPTSSIKRGDGTIGGVSGPFHFLEMACQLIAQLAS